MSTSVNDFLLAGGTPSAKFPTVGTLIKGSIVESEVTQQTDLEGKLKFWDNQQPMMQAVITLQTDLRDPEIDDDQGLRKLYVKGQMQAAVREAIKQSGAKGLDIGGTLAVKYDRDERPSKAGYNAKKVYVAQYVPPAPSTDAANDLLGASSGGDAQPAATSGVAASDLI